MGQLACLEKETEALQFSFGEMIGPWICRNPPSTGKEELTRNTPGATTKSNGTPTTKGSGTPTSTPATSRASTPTPASAPASAPIFDPLGRYTDKDLQRATKLALKLFV